jgi:hypothetical protein
MRKEQKYGPKKIGFEMMKGTKKDIMLIFE